MKNLNLFEIYIASEREKISEYISKKGLNDNVLKELNKLLLLSLINSKREVNAFSGKEFFDGVLGASVIMGGTDGKIVTTEIVGNRAIFFDLKLLEYAMFLLISDCLKSISKFLKISVNLGGIIEVKFSADKIINLSDDSILCSKLLKGNIVVVDKEIVLSIKNGIQTKKICKVKKEYEYLSDPYSVAYIALNSVCINPAVQEQPLLP